MEEMKLHRKLLIIQNQYAHTLTSPGTELMSRTEILQCKKKDLEDFETRLRGRASAIVEREKQMQTREAEMAERESGIAAKEAAAVATQDRLNHAAEALRGQWDKLKEEQELFRERQQLAYAGDGADNAGYGESLYVVAGVANR
jgi:uncharacterized protein (DUF3084 family)